MRKKFNNTYYLLLLTGLVACKKNEDNGGYTNMCNGPQQTLYITHSDLLNCEYKTGTYWVYYDSVTNVIDSVYVLSYKQDFLNDGCVTTYQYHSYLTWSSAFSNNTNYVVVIGGLFKGFDGSPNSGTLIYPELTSLQGVKHDSAFVFDQYYMNVRELIVDDDPTEANNKSIYFVNSDYGLLKQEIYSNNTLINRRVIQRKNIVR